MQGRDAACDQPHLANDVDGEAGRITYTQGLNDQRTLEADTR